MSSKTITVCSSFLIFVLLTSVFSFPASQNNGFFAFAETGDIDDEVINSLEFDDERGQDPQIIHVSGDVFAIVYEGPGTDGFLITVEIGSDGTIDPTDVGGDDDIIDTLEFDPDRGEEPKIIHVSGDVFAIIYESPDSKGSILTVEIGSDGIIDPTDVGGVDDIIDARLFASVSSNEDSDIIHVSGDVFAIAFEGPSNTGKVRTVSIDSVGMIELIALLEFAPDPDRPRPKIINVSGDIFAIVYEGEDNGDVGSITTIDINRDGTFDGVVETLVFDPVDGDEPDIIHVAGNVFAIVDDPSSRPDTLTTLEISNDGTFIEVIEQFEFTDEFDEPEIERVSGDVFIIAWENDSGPGARVTTIVIERDGSIGEVIDEFDFEPAGSNDDPAIICVDHWVISNERFRGGFNE